MNKDSRVLVGKVSGCFGVKGWLKIFSYCDPRENITTYKSWIVGGKVFDSVESKRNGKLIVAKLKGIDDKDIAMTLIGQTVEIREDQLERLRSDQFYWRDLVGLEVTNTKGIAFGKITNLLETGANDVIIIKGERERLVPYITDADNGRTVIEVDIEKKTMVVEWHEDD
jgi:16S rRNA processing protein RimM